MRNSRDWKETKYVYRKGRLAASRNASEVSMSSRLIADLVAGKYQQSLPEHASGRLLDLGCGKAPLYHVYRDHVTDTVCADWQDSIHDSLHIDVYCDLSQALPFADGEFDTIILSDVLEHVPEPELVWREIARVLAADGKILMNVPFFYRLHEQPHDYFRYTEFALRRFVETSGLDLIKLEAVGGAPEILADIFAKLVLRFPLLGAWTAMFVQWLAQSFGRTKAGRKISLATGKDFPLGYFLIARKPC